MATTFIGSNAAFAAALYRGIKKALILLSGSNTMRLIDVSKFIDLIKVMADARDVALNGEASDIALTGCMTKLIAARVEQGVGVTTLRGFINAPYQQVRMAMSASRDLRKIVVLEMHNENASVVPTSTLEGSKLLQALLHAMIALNEAETNAPDQDDLDAVVDILRRKVHLVLRQPGLEDISLEGLADGHHLMVTDMLRARSEKKVAALIGHVTGLRYIALRAMSPLATRNII